MSPDAFSQSIICTGISSHASEHAHEQSPMNVAEPAVTGDEAADTPRSLSHSSTSTAPTVNRRHDCKPASLHLDIGGRTSNTCFSSGSSTCSLAVSDRQQQKHPSEASPAARQAACCLEEVRCAAPPHSGTGEGMPPLGSAFPAGQPRGAHLAHPTAGLAGSSSSGTSSRKSFQNWSSSNRSSCWVGATSRSSCTKHNICSAQKEAAGVAEHPGSLPLLASHAEALLGHLRRPAAAAAGTAGTVGG